MESTDVEEEEEFERPPGWLVEAKNQLSLIDIFYMAFTTRYNCKVCRAIRKNIKYWRPLFKPRRGERVE